MTTILRSAASGLLAQQANLDIIANNISNINTTGYKKTRALLADAAYETGPLEAPGGLEPSLEVRAGAGVTLAAAQRLFTPGNLQETGNTWDLAIAGDGFFQVSLGDGRLAYTRDGAFQVDGEGRLCTVGGLLVEPPITIPPDAENVQIDSAGTVWAALNGQATELGSIAVVSFPNSAGLLAMGGNLYTATEASGGPQPGMAGEEGRGQIVSGVLEASNVDIAEEMTRAIEAQRAYQLSIKLVQAADEMLAMANNLRK